MRRIMSIRFRSVLYICWCPRILCSKHGWRSTRAVLTARAHLKSYTLCGYQPQLVADIHIGVTRLPMQHRPLLQRGGALRAVGEFRGRPMPKRIHTMRKWMEYCRHRHHNHHHHHYVPQRMPRVSSRIPRTVPVPGHWIVCHVHRRSHDDLSRRI
jgi:hypothetical protein